MKKNMIEVAQEAALKAGKILMASYGKLSSGQISVKSKNDFVTVVDKASEKSVVSTIRKYFPHHAIQGEEGGVTTGRDALWIIDPLDGTSNYIHQFPLFAVSIGVEDKKGLAAGVIYDPLHREMFWAVRGKGAYLNKKKIRVSAVPKLEDALLTTGIPFRARARYHEYMKSLETFSLATVGLRRGGSAALDMAYVACGRFDGFWEMDLSPWDIAAGAVIIAEAGGRVTDLWGADDFLKNGDTLCSNGRIHGELCAVTKPIFSPVTTDKRCRLS